MPKAKRAAQRKIFLNQGARPNREQAQRRAAYTPPQRMQPKPPPLRIPNYLDPLCNHPVPTVISEGKALPYTGMVSSDFTVTGTTDSKLIIATNPGDTSTMAIVVTLDANGHEVADSMETMDIPTLTASDQAGGPSAMRAMKYSSTLVNCTSALRVGGRVTYLNSSQRLPSVTGTDQTTTPPSGLLNFAAIVAAVKSSPYRKRINAQELTKPSALVGYPTDTTHYLNYKPSRGSVDAAAFLSYVCTPNVFTTDPATVPPVLTSALERPMSIQVWILEPVSQPNDYSLTIRAANYTRWPLTSIPGQIMLNTPTAPPEHINGVNNHGESTANDLKSAAEGGAGAVILPKVAGLVRSAGGYFMVHAQQAGRGMVGALEDAVPAMARAGAQLALHA